MHKTASGDKRKALRKEALELAMQSRAAMKAAGVLPQAGPKARELQEEADRLRAVVDQLGALIGGRREKTAPDARRAKAAGKAAPASASRKKSPP